MNNPEYKQAPTVLLIENIENQVKFNEKIDEIRDWMREQHSHEEFPNPFTGLRFSNIVALGTTAVSINVTSIEDKTNKKNGNSAKDYIVLFNNDPNQNIDENYAKYIKPRNNIELLSWKDNQNKLKVKSSYQKIRPPKKLVKGKR